MNNIPKQKTAKAAMAIALVAIAAIAAAMCLYSPPIIVRDYAA